ncbi:MAG: S8 family serine peptidase [Eggerthellaceae bacterium]|nr:S8 family serine peptidase [Eggerthellaceae bacterium]
MKKQNAKGMFYARRARMGRTLGVASVFLCLIIWGVVSFVPAQQPALIQEPLKSAAVPEADDASQPDTPLTASSEPSDSTSDSDDSDGESPESAVAPTLSLEEAARANIIVSTPGELLLSVSEGATAESVNAFLRSVDFIVTEDVSDQDLSLGFVQVALSDDVTPEQASERLRETGAQAQPNYVYYLMDDVVATQAIEATAEQGEQENLGTSSGDAARDRAAEEAADTPESQIESADDAASAAHSESSLTAADVDVAQLDALPAQSAEEAASDLDAQSLVIDDPDQSWMLDSVKARAAWELAGVDDAESGFSPVIVAVVDSGCNVNHPDLAGNVVGAYNVVTGESGLSAMTDTNGHGTHVAGIIAATANNAEGVAGVSYNAQLYPVKVMTGRSTDSAKLAKAYSHLISQKQRGANIRVINLSIGGYQTSTDVDDLQLMSYMNRAYQNGILTVCAAGNSTSHKVPYSCFPCDFVESTVGVINLDRAGDSVRRATGSNYNEASQATKDISAPGTDITSTWCDGSYATESGTSMASPCVAGVAALMFGVNGSLTPYGATYLLAQSANDLVYTNGEEVAGEGWDVYTGYGEVNAYEAVKQEMQYIASGNSLFVGGTLRVSANNTGGSSYEWSCESQGIISLEGEGSSCVVTGLSSGEAKVSVTYTAYVWPYGMRTVTESATVTVYDASICDAQSIEFGGSTAYSVACDPNATWLWSSSDESVATVDETDGTVTGAGVGTATIRATMLSNPSLTLEQTVTVGPTSISKASIQAISSQEYTGSAVTPKPVVTANGVTLEEGVDYTLTYENNVAPGKGSVIVSGKGNYTGSIRAAFNIVQGSKNMYRLYNPNSGEHFYTASTSERDGLRKLGWRYEGVGWLAPKTGNAVYRLYNPNGGDHHYTMSVEERDGLRKLGWRYEGIGWYSDTYKATPLYRQYNPNAKSGSHNYTVSKSENDKLVRLGWRAEGIGWYGL